MKLKEDQIENKEITNKRTAKIELAKDRISGATGQRIGGDGSKEKISRKAREIQE